MNERIEREILEDVLNDYVDSTPAPDHAILAEWVKRYPQYAQELIEFTVSWMQMETLPPASDWSEADAERLIQAGHAIMPTITAQQLEQEETQPLSSLTAAAQGLNLQQIAERSALSPALVRKLDRRLIRPTRIPSEAIQALATTIQVPPREVARYLQGTAKLPQGASYRAEQAPTLAEPEDFFDAVRNDRSMSQELKERWLALEPNDNQ